MQHFEFNFLNLFDNLFSILLQKYHLDFFFFSSLTKILFQNTGIAGWMKIDFYEAMY